MKIRQKHLTKLRYENFLTNYDEEFEFWKDKLFTADSPEQEKSLRARNFKNFHLKHVFMLYTAGEDIQSLIQPLETLIASYEELQKHQATYEQIPNITPLIIDDWPDEYEECLQVISLCILLQRTDLLKRFVFLIDNAGYASADTLYEDLLIKVLPERADIDQWFHDVSTPLIQAIYAEDRNEASRFLSNYCENWYSTFEQAPWHDTHLDGEEGSYVGYWAFEAGAIAYLYGVDDSKLDHMVYPKDLVQYARSVQSK
ncbi:PoNe immunity protein domain-containing protein [Pseudomonas iridis]|uniref:PoNe immunity protein domain-containing protein n=1 Tax=Pseudomonas iridis TaxID=2710587 RepID=UPI001B321D04|nr:PoNe immunity protein domain-containing protein [Pseudomonas iridis]MBP5970928.1 DUF1911 domain-containing protein [Pseudomonas iridis]